MMSETTSRFPLISPDAAPSAQEVFDKAAAWLMSQAEQCNAPEEVDDEGESVGGGYCCYRSVDGQNACAVGAFMPDDFARMVDAAGEQSIDDVLETYPQAPAWFQIHSVLLKDLQAVHDGRSSRPAALADVAKKYGLLFASPIQSEGASK
jgi:hypothetical protein